MIGEMEETKFFRFCRMQALRALFNEGQLPDGAHEIIPIFLATYHGQSRGTLQDEMGRTNPRQRHNKSTSSEALKVMQDWVKHGQSSAGPSPKITSLSYVARFRQRFEALKGGNSHVIFEDSCGGTTSVGTIQGIFECDGESYFVIRQHLHLSPEDAPRDFFRQLPSAGYLVYSTFESDFTVVPFPRIKSHLAKTSFDPSDLGIKSPCFHILPLPGN
jgi:hypothetical protein